MRSTLMPLVSSAPPVRGLLRCLAIQGQKGLRHPSLAGVRPRQKHAAFQIWGPAGEVREDWESSCVEDSDIEGSRLSRSMFPLLPSPCRTIFRARVRESGCVPGDIGDSCRFPRREGCGPCVALDRDLYATRHFNQDKLNTTLEDLWLEIGGCFVRFKLPVMISLCLWGDNSSFGTHFWSRSSTEQSCTWTRTPRVYIGCSNRTCQKAIQHCKSTSGN